MNAVEKENLINEYRQAIGLLGKTIHSVSDDAAKFKGAVDHWSILEHLVHIMDYEIAGYSRYRRSIAETGMHVDVYDESKWKGSLNYESFDLKKTMKLLELLIDLITTHLAGIVNEDWTLYYVDNPEKGEVDLVALIEFRIWHIGVHHEYILRNKKLYEEIEK